MASRFVRKVRTASGAVAVQVVATASLTRWGVLTAAYERLRFEALGDEAFKSLVLARVVEPTSKADTARVLADIGVPAPSSRNLNALEDAGYSFIVGSRTSTAPARSDRSRCGGAPGRVCDRHRRIAGFGRYLVARGHRPRSCHPDARGRRTCLPAKGLR